MKAVIKRDYYVSAWNGARSLGSFVVTEAPDQRVVGETLCPHGVRRHFGVGNSTKPVELIFSKGKPRGEEGEQACKITFEQELDDNGKTYPWQTDTLNTLNYDLYLDGVQTGLGTLEEDMVFDLWKEGYNYVRAEIVG